MADKCFSRLHEPAMILTFDLIPQNVMVMWDLPKEEHVNIAMFSGSEMSSSDRRLNLTTKRCPLKREVLPGYRDCQILVA